jgi:CysZ protein
MVRELAAGVLDGLRGAAYLARHRRLWKWVVAPALVVTLVAVVTMGWLLAIIGAIGLVGWTSLAIASATVIVAFAFLVAGPFNELLSEAIEEREAGLQPPGFSIARFLHEIAISIAHAARRGVAHIAFIVCLFVIARIVPVVGTVAAAAGSAWVAARFASYAAYDAIWSRRHWQYREKTAYLREHRWRTLGLGALVAATLVVPGLNIVGLAIGSTGATLRMIERERRDKLPTVRTSAG